MKRLYPFKRPNAARLHDFFTQEATRYLHDADKQSHSAKLHSLAMAKKSMEAAVIAQRLAQ